MPIKSREDAVEVEERIERIFDSAPRERAGAIRGMFVEVLDFDAASGWVELTGAPGNADLPNSAERIAQLDGVHVVYVALATRGTDRVRKGEAVAAAKRIAEQLGDDLLLVFTNPSVSQLHIIHPSFEGAQPTLRRMVVERDVPRRTAVQQVSNIYWNRKETGSVRTALEKAFDVEPVTKAFFAEYKKIFEAAEESVSGFGDDKEEKDAKRLFVQTLFNRLMFVYFLQRKGWLSFQGEKDYLNALWDDYCSISYQTNFYTTRLYHLFFAGLNNPQSRNLSRDNLELHASIGNVPFLNGGLFEQTDLDRRPGVIVPDGAIEQVLRGLFDRFNFTVMESTPFDIEVAVDPEMLGKVFEELVTGRHASGSYYTPRPVVSFMCREALKGYLEGQDSGLSAEAVAKFVDEYDTSDIPFPAAGKVGGALNEVTVVDPACGSGAYLLGMMQELVELHLALYNARADNRSLYELKLHIIQRNLYGVDNDEFAVNIAMLRMWLSLAIDYEGDSPPPLPNLDFKVVRGDSLLGPDPSPEDYGDLFRHQAQSVAGRLVDLKAKYMATTGPDKDTLRGEIESVQKQLTAALADSPAPNGSVDWRVQFAEVFAMSGGFDIAVANPPYVRMEKLDKKDEISYMRLYPEVAASRADILVYFYARALQTLKSKGWLTFITSNTFTNRGFGSKLRSHLANKLTISTLIDFGELKVFDATVATLVLIGRNTSPGPEAIVSGHNLYPYLARRIGRSGNVERVREQLLRLPEHLKSEVSPFPQSRLTHLEWRIEDEKTNRLFHRLMDEGTPLGKFVKGRIYMGVKTGLNGAFVIDQTKRDELIEADSRSVELIKSWLRGKDIDRWRANWAGLYIIFTSRGVDIDQYPAIKEHLEWFRDGLEKRATVHLSLV